MIATTTAAAAWRARLALARLRVTLDRIESAVEVGRDIPTADLNDYTGGTADVAHTLGQYRAELPDDGTPLRDPEIGRIGDINPGDRFRPTGTNRPFRIAEPPGAFGFIEGGKRIVAIEYVDDDGTRGEIKVPHGSARLFDIHRVTEGAF